MSAQYSGEQRKRQCPKGTEDDSVANKKWIQKAIKHPGALTRKAKSAGTSTMAFARAHRSSKGTTGRQARLAITLSRLHKR